MVRVDVAIWRDQRRDVNTGSSEWEIPDDFSGARLERPNAAVAGAENKLLQAADRQTRRRAECGVVRARARSIDPAQFAGCFVEAHEAVGRDGKTAPLRLIAPSDHDGTDQQIIFEDNGNVRPAAVCGNRPVLFVQGVVPNKLARFAFQAAKVAAKALSIDASGFRIADD